MVIEEEKTFLFVCPETGKVLKPNRKHRWLMWLFPVTGLIALIWFLTRVIPKPSRAAYPCQRVAAPLASGFIVWITGLIVSTLAYRKARRVLRRSRYVLAGIFLVMAVTAVWLSLSVTAENRAGAAFTPSDPPNTPMGVAKGIYPGRVVWVHDPAATGWNGSTGYWWDDNNTDQNTVDSMMAKSIRTLTGQVNDSGTWDALFRHFNQTKGKGDVGYQAGEKIVIKINENNQNNPYATENVAIDASPQMVRGLLRQLVYEAGVPQTAIIVYDTMRPISDPVYNRCHPEFPEVDYRSGHGYPNRLSPNFVWVSNVITYSVGYTASDGRNVPQCVLDAEYMINMAILKKHSMNAAGVTLCFKNHFGTIGSPSGLHDQGYWQRNWGMDAYDLLVDITGHEDIGAKTVLYIIDGLYGSKAGVCEAPTKWASKSFSNDWPSSIFVSQDPVAIDSVGLDFLRAECTLLGNADNYLHEAAQADNPPSGTFYDPEGDGTRLAGLGVHEHWNNPVDRQYSRNLGAGDGIELLILSLASIDGPVENLTSGKRYDFIQYAISDADPDDEIVVNQGTYHENIDFGGKNLTVRSTNPDDPDIVAATVINGGSRDPVVTFSGGEGPSCVLDGLTITGGTVGISCRGAVPTIRNCTIGSAGAIAIEFWGSEPAIIDCTVLGEVVDHALVAYWRLDETEGDIAYDSIGENYAVVFGDALWQPDGGQVNGALAFDGIDDYVSTAFVLDPSDGPFSVFAWVKGGVPGQVIISQAAGVNWLAAYASEGNLMTELRYGGRVTQPPLLSQTVITDGAWHRVGFVWNGSNKILYVDDVEVARDTQIDLTGSEGGLFIGADKSLEPGSFFSGLIDDVRIYNQAVTP